MARIHRRTIYKKESLRNDSENHDGVITHLESDILECEVKCASGSITMSKASGGDGIPVELFQTLKDDAVQVLHSICQQIWKTQQWTQDWKRSVFIPIPKKVKVKVTQSCLTLCDPMDYPWNSLGQNTGVGSLSLLQGIFPTQESNQGLLPCMQVFYKLSYEGSPKMVAKELIQTTAQLLSFHTLAK